MFSTRVRNGNPYLPFLNLDTPLTSLPVAMFTDKGFLHFCATTSLAAIAIIANVYLIVFIARTKSTRICKNSCYGYYLLHLCMVEIIMAALSIPFSLVCHSENLEHLMSFYEIGCIVKRLLCCVCHGTIAAMVYQRFLCLHNSIRKRKAFVNLKISLCFVWFWAMGNLIPQVVLFTKSSKATEDKETSVNTIALMISSLIIPFMVTLYSRLGLSRLHSKDSVLLLKRCRQYRKFASVCLLMSCVLVAANLPEFIVNLLIQLNYEKKIRLKPSTDFFWSTITLAWVYLSLLPIMYCLSYRVKLTKEQKGLKDKNNNIASMIESRFFASPGPLRHAFLPTTSSLDPNTRRRSLFDRRKSSSSLDDALDVCSRRFSEPNVDLNPQLIISCLSTLESIYESHTEKKSFFKNTWRRLSGVPLESTEETLASSSQELSTFSHVVHKLNQKSPNTLQVEMPYNV